MLPMGSVGMTMISPPCENRSELRVAEQFPMLDRSTRSVKGAYPTSASRWAEAGKIVLPGGDPQPFHHAVHEVESPPACSRSWEGPTGMSRAVEEGDHNAIRGLLTTDVQLFGRCQSPSKASGQPVSCCAQRCPDLSQRREAGVHGSGSGSAPVAATASRSRKCFQPVAWRGAWLAGRLRWTRWRWVPLLVGVRVNSTRVAPGGMSVLPATPQLTTTRCGGSISR